jgi:deoxyribonuclease V
MRIVNLHPWDLSPADAVTLQKELAALVDVRTPVAAPHLIAGADVSYNRFSTHFFATVVVLRADDLTVVESQGAAVDVQFPYVPGLLTFREAPALLAAFAKVQSEPDVVVLDGHGQAHPRRLGLASHLGLWLDRPTLGCGKSKLFGTFTEPGPAPGDVSPLKDRSEVIGMAVRTKKKALPVFVSAGHKIDLPSAVRIVLACLRGYRIPEPTRQAHLHVNALRRAGTA